MKEAVSWYAMLLVVGGALFGTLLTSVSPAEAQLLNPPQVLLEVHPNERAQGFGAAPKLGTAPWTSSGLTGAWYTWKIYEFWGSDSLWIQVCGQNFNNLQNSSGKGDMLQLKLDGKFKNDYWGIMTGPAPASQWKGDTDGGNRLTLEFLYTPQDGIVVGKHQLKISAKETPIIWWIKVYDMNQRVLD